MYVKRRMKLSVENRAAALVAAAAAIILAGLLFASPLRNDFMVDFRAFYCAGNAIARQSNPYLQQPLQHCEDAARAPLGGGMPANVALPAPLPPYILAAYGIFSLVPFAAALIAYGVLLIAAFVAALRLLQKLTELPMIAVGATFIPIACGDAILRGQPLTLVLLALAAAALFARRGEWWKASVAIFCVGAQPQAALPAVVALFLLAPKARLPIVVVATALLAVSLAFIGPSAALSYISRVLPAHALANASEWQLSLTSILSSAGYPVGVAVRWGELSYFALASVGVIVGLSLSRKFRDPAFALFVPPAFALFLGIHVHYQQLPLAFPALLLLARYAPRVKALIAVALVLAVVQPLDTATIPLLTVTWLFVTVVFGLTLTSARGSLYIAILPCIVLAITAIAVAFGPAVHPQAAFVVHTFPPSALAEESWADFQRQVLRGTTPAMQWLRAVTLAGVALGLTLLAAVAFRPSMRGSDTAVARPPNALC